MNTTHLAILFFAFFVAVPLAQAQICYVTLAHSVGSTQCQIPPFDSFTSWANDTQCSFTVCQVETRDGVNGEMLTYSSRTPDDAPKPVNYVQLKYYRDENCGDLKSIRYLDTSPCTNATNMYVTCDQSNARARFYRGTQGCNSSPVLDDTYPIGKCVSRADGYVIASCNAAEQTTPVATSDAMAWSSAVYLQALLVVSAAICLV